MNDSTIRQLGASWWRNLGAALVLAMGLAVSAPSLGAQVPDSVFNVRRSSPLLVKYGKWAVLGAAVGMGVKAALAHSDADDAYDRLEAYCDVDESRCDTGPGGSYLDPIAERRYQRAVTRDRHARGWLLGGEAALLGAAGLFVWELTRPKDHPDNIPFEPKVSVEGRRTRLGLSVAF